MDCDDAWMVERCDGPCLMLKARAAIGIGHRSVGKNFERNVALEPSVARAIDLAHATAAEQRQNFVSAEAGSRNQGQLLGTAELCHAKAIDCAEHARAQDNR